MFQVIRGIGSRYPMWRKVAMRNRQLIAHFAKRASRGQPRKRRFRKFMIGATGTLLVAKTIEYILKNQKASRDEKSFTVEERFRLSNGIPLYKPTLRIEGEEYDWNEFEGRYIKTGRIKVSDERTPCYQKGQMKNAYATKEGIQIVPDLEDLDLEKIDVTSTNSLLKLIDTGTVVFEKRDPDEWDREWVVSLVTDIKGSRPRMGGNHSWVQFKSPEGHVLSFGLYRTEERRFHHQLGYIHQVDPREGKRLPNYRRRETDLPVQDKSEWGEMLRFVLLQIKENKAHYHQVGYNCIDFTREILSKSSVKPLPARVYGFEFLPVIIRHHTEFIPGMDSLMHQVQDWTALLAERGDEDPLVKRLCVATNVVFSLLYESGKVDPAIDDGRPYVASYEELTDPKKMMFYSPAKMAKSQDRIADFRIEKKLCLIQELRDSVENSSPGACNFLNALSKVQYAKTLEEEEEYLKILIKYGPAVDKPDFNDWVVKFRKARLELP